MTRPFHPDELRGRTGSDDPTELAAALEAARLLERAVGADGVRPSPDFTTGVMAAIASQPAPRRSRLALLAGMLQGAWRTALAAGQPPMIRARAIAIILVAVVALGSVGGAATLAAAGAIDLFGPHGTPTPLLSPGPTTRPTHEPSTSPNPGLTPEPTELESPGEPPEASETPEPGETPEPTGTDDHGGGGGSGGDGGGSATPRPSRTPRATDKPEPTETPEPTEAPEPSDH